MESFKPFLEKLVASGSEGLSEKEAYRALTLIMGGSVAPVQIGAFLMGLQVRGETTAEMIGALRSIRDHMIPVQAPASAIDIVGTGGDAKNSYNISTCTAFVVAACGVPVAKHGNRSISSRSGSADVLRALGVVTSLSSENIRTCIERVGIGFIFAPRHHSALRHVAAVRQELGLPTLFNFLGPLANPAGVKFQLIGVYKQTLLEKIANVIRHYDQKHVWVVCGDDGFDEVSITGITHVIDIQKAQTHRFTISPEQVGLPRSSPEALRGGTPAENALALRDVLAGKRSAYADSVLINAAASLFIAGRVSDLSEGVTLAQESINRGKALECLDALVVLSQELSRKADNTNERRW